MKSLEALAPPEAGEGRTFSKTPLILFASSSTVFVIEVTISIGDPFLPMKNSDGNGTNLSAI